MEKGVYHIKYQFFKNQLYVNPRYYDGLFTLDGGTLCCYRAYGRRSHSFHSTGFSIGTIVNRNPNFNYGDGSIYEVIVDMNKREFWISHNNSFPVLLVKDLPSTLYPFVSLGEVSTSFQLLSFYIIIN